jgi:hypothetical protein
VVTLIVVIMKETGEEKATRLAIELSLKQKERTEKAQEDREKRAIEKAIQLSLNGSRDVNRSSKREEKDLKEAMTLSNKSQVAEQKKASDSQSVAEDYADVMELSLQDQCGNEPQEQPTFHKTETISFPKNMKNTFYSARSILEFKYGIKVIIFGKENKLQISAADECATAIAKQAIDEIIANPAILDKEIADLQEQNIHVFIDQSNIFISSQYMYHTQSRRVERDVRIRIKTAALDHLIVGGRNIREKVVFGSFADHNNNGNSNQSLSEKWKRLHYRITFVPRVHHHQNSSSRKEHLVDNALIAEIQRSLITFQSPPHPQHTLVLLTGDGNNNDGMVSFYEVVNLALMQGWKVELWTWKLALSKNYFNYLNSYSGTGNFKIFYLDDYRDIITYIHDPNAVSLRERNERTGFDKDDEEDNHNHDHQYRQKNVHPRDNNNDRNRDSDYDSMNKRRKISPQREGGGGGGGQEHITRSSNASFHSDHHDYRDRRHEDNRTCSSSDHYYHHHSHSNQNSSNNNNSNNNRDRNSASTSYHHQDRSEYRHSSSSDHHDHYPQRRNNEDWLPEGQGQHANYHHHQTAQSRRTPPPGPPPHRSHSPQQNHQNRSNPRQQGNSSSNPMKPPASPLPPPLPAPPAKIPPSRVVVLTDDKDEDRKGLPPSAENKQNDREDSLDIIDISDSEDEDDEEGEEHEENDWMNCPITCSLIEEPIMTCYGHVFEKRAITNWIKNKHTCPMTKKPLELQDLKEVSQEYRQRLEDFKKRIFFLHSNH